ncbi:hypothetical protein ACLMJK_000101 [Lecanora helva]
MPPATTLINTAAASSTVSLPPPRSHPSISSSSTSSLVLRTSDPTSVTVTKTTAITYTTDRSSGSDISSTVAISTFITAIAIPTPSSSPTSSPTPAASSSIPKTKNFQIGVSIGAVVFAAMIVALIWWCRRRRRPRNSPPPSLIEPRVPDQGLASGPQYGMSQPPNPNPYTQPFPLHQSATNNTGPANNQSRFNAAIIPDHDPERYHSQPNLRNAPALSPYHIHAPTAAASSANFSDPGNRRNWSPAPSYRTEDPLQANPAPRTHRRARRAEPRVREVRGYE